MPWVEAARCETIVDTIGKGDVVDEILEPADRLPFLTRLIGQFQAYELEDRNLAQDIVMMLAQAAHRARERDRRRDAQNGAEGHRLLLS